MDVVLILIASVAAPALMARAQLRPVDPAAPIAVIYAPWVDSAAAATRATVAGSSLLRSGAFGFVVFVKPDRPDFSDRVLAGGALFALDARAIAWCASDVRIGWSSG
ncbi:hypothetical protein [Terrarubrum flagellatum]|uniref:hypothetical protein n=1 Tax=Terrirubrum flagellatum TaxID=2895980 RepID=UPI0031456E79